MTVVDLPAQATFNVDTATPATRVTHDSGGGAVLWLSGEHDLATKTQLCEVLALEFSAHDHDLIVDLSDVAFMDCSTVGALIAGKEWMTRQHRWMSVRAPSPCARRLLDLCGLNGLLDTRASAGSSSPRTFPGGPQSRPGWVRRAG